MPSEKQVETTQEQVVAQAPEANVAAENSATPAVQPVQSHQQQVQYVTMVQEKSLKGVGGWLIFFLVVFGLATIGYTTMFFASFLNLPNAAATTLFAPFIIAGLITSIVLIAQHKKIAKLATWITLAVMGVYTVINGIVSIMLAEDGYFVSRGTVVVTVLGSMFAGLIVLALIGVYFYSSRRVKETLIK